VPIDLVAVEREASAEVAVERVMLPARGSAGPSSSAW
jgi:hypothetical protein